jgi:hypothetical protein
MSGSPFGNQANTNMVIKWQSPPWQYNRNWCRAGCWPPTPVIIIKSSVAWPGASPLPTRHLPQIRVQHKASTSNCIAEDQQKLYCCWLCLFIHLSLCRWYKNTISTSEYIAGVCKLWLAKRMRLFGPLVRPAKKIHFFFYKWIKYITTCCVKNPTFNACGLRPTSFCSSVIAQVWPALL